MVDTNTDPPARVSRASAATVAAERACAEELHARDDVEMCRPRWRRAAAHPPGGSICRFCEAACRRATSIIPAARSIPVTVAPARASDSHKRPPPQPASRTRAPASALRSAMNWVRTGFSRCSGRNSLPDPRSAARAHQTWRAPPDRPARRSVPSSQSQCSRHNTQGPQKYSCEEYIGGDALTPHVLCRRHHSQYASSRSGC